MSDARKAAEEALGDWRTCLAIHDDDCICGPMAMADALRALLAEPDGAGAKPHEATRAVRLIVETLYLYPNYRVDYRSCRGNLTDAVACLDPESAAILRDPDGDIGMLHDELLAREESAASRPAPSPACDEVREAADANRERHRIDPSNPWAPWGADSDPGGK